VSVSNRTDGIIKFAELELIPRCKSAHADEMARVGLWRRRDDGWLITVYKTTQRSRKQLESDDKYHERERERVAALRAAAREQAQVSELERADVRAYERTDNKGQGRAGQDTNVSSYQRKVKKQQGEERTKTAENSHEVYTPTARDLRRIEEITREGYE
jgi:hypothetical protein